MIEAGAGYEIARRPPPAALAGIVTEFSGYREFGARLDQRQAASLTVPLIFSFGSPFAIRFGAARDAPQSAGSFAAGLWAGPVDMASDGHSACLQIDFTPPGAWRMFGGAVADLAGAMVDPEALFGADARRLRERLAQAPDWAARFDLAEAFVGARLGPAPSGAVAHGWRRLVASAGAARIDALAGDIGWSRKHFGQRFAAEIGLGPKQVARILRFDRACVLARCGRADGWAGIALDAGYADQPHLIREFNALAGESPAAWARRAALHVRSG